MLAGFAGLILGVVLMLFGTDSLTKGVIGVTVWRPNLAFASTLWGTVLAAILPALAVMLAALLAGNPDLAVGGLIGASIAQLGLVLALAALLMPLSVRVRALALVNPALIATVLLLWLLALDYRLSRLDGAILLLAVLVVVILGVRRHGASPLEVREQLAPAARRVGGAVLAARMLIGALLLGWGAWQAVAAGGGLAQDLGWSPLLFGLTILGACIALAGASAPLLAARQGRGDLAVGHALIGALANVSLLLAAMAIWRPLAMAQSLRWVELPVLLALALALYPMLRSDGALSRREAMILLLVYVLFLVAEIWLLAGS